MRIIAIDPGPLSSAWLQYEAGLVAERPELLNNNGLLQVLNYDTTIAPHHLAIEMVDSYGMPVGKSIFETVLWTGRFIEAWGGPFTLVYRREVKQVLCGNARAKDANVRQAVIDRFPAQGGGKVPQIGTKKQPGPLYGIKRDLWSALAVAITWTELHGEKA